MLFWGIAVVKHPVGQGRKEPSGGKDSCGQCRAATSLQVGRLLQAACRSHFGGGACEAPDSEVRLTQLFPAELFRALQKCTGSQALRLADLHPSHNPKLPEPRVCEGHRDFLNCFHSRILKCESVSRCFSKEMPTSCSSPALQCRALLLLSQPSCFSSPPAAMSS